MELVPFVTQESLKDREFIYGSSFSLKRQAGIIEGISVYNVGMKRN